ncbi:hypothetical protein [Nocardioides zhouii]|uniref:Uncharacterized protein n=1 Tax=Nocardioides zhouii TaxID=1168729 RepID=A0A4Q2T5B6_9ACTN|nr:hypothetical protein [Nocardioides zhouii]RYC13281.1 hypothetical protein EUA94_05240 [Nocardioides zhouii]
MSDLDQNLDRAFEALTRDLAHSPGPGAAAAMSTSRRRRRTRVGAVALAALVVVGGGLAVPRLVSPEDGVASNGRSARLDTAAIAAATDGWIGEWETWERYSPWGGGSFSTASCSYLGGPGGDQVPEPTSRGNSRFVSHSGASAVLVFSRYADPGVATSAEGLSTPAPNTCATTTTYDVDGVQVRHDSMPPDPVSDADMWLGDVWTVRIGADRAQLELVNDTGVADDATAEEVAEALVAGLRDGWTQSGMTEVTSQPVSRGQLPDWPDVDLDGALAGWQSASRAEASPDPNVPCLDEVLAGGTGRASAGGTPRGVTWRVAGYDGETTASAGVAAMLDELRSCRTGGMQVETLPNGVHVVTYDVGGEDGRGAIWFASNGDRAGLIAVDGANRPMPMDVREDVADLLYEILRLPWD